MIKILTSSGDTYITNKIVDGSFSVSGNVGRAGTLDLFKLYDESVPTGSNEISRILLNFDLSPISNLSATLDPGDPTFKSYLQLRSLSLGQAVPSKFTVSVFPLSSSFQEGMGRDIVSFADVDAANWLSSSNGTLWNVTGCGLGADLSSQSDYMTSDTAGGITSFECTQFFEAGNEDLSVDVTRIVSASLTGRLNFKGFRVAFSGSNETDTVTRFAKRFGSGNAREFSIRPKLIVQCNDSRVDNRSSSFTDVDNRLYYYSSNRGFTAPFSELNGNPVTGSGCIILTLSTSSLSLAFTGSEVTTTSGTRVPGVYFVSFFVSASNNVTGSQTVDNFLTASGSIKFNETLKTKVGNRTLRTGTVTVRKPDWNTTTFGEPQLVVSTTCTSHTFKVGQQSRVTARFFDRNEESRASKFPLQAAQVEYYNPRIRLRDATTGELLFDYCDGSKMSIDSNGSYFELPTDGMKVGGSYSIEYEITRLGKTYNVVDRSTLLKVT